jgi:hypothetical protein
MEGRLKLKHVNRYYACRSEASKRKIHTRTLETASGPAETVSLLGHTSMTSTSSVMSHQQHEDENTGRSHYQKW